MRPLNALISILNAVHLIIRITFPMGVISLALFGCVSKGTLPEIATADFKSRAVVRSDGVVRVTTSALSVVESFAVYGVPLAVRGIQPVWIEVTNGGDEALWLLSPGMDPNFFPASEAAEAFASLSYSDDLEQRFTSLAFLNPVPAGGTVSGFVLTNLDEGVKMVHVDLVASGQLISLSSMNFVPGFRADYHSREAFLDEIYSAAEMTDYEDDEAFRNALEELPCCVTNEDGSRNGDPLNLVIVGGRDDAFTALVRRDWRPTEETWYGSVTEMGASALSGEGYRYAPVSPLYLYGRSQDLALQKGRDNVHQRNHLRLWLSPIRYHGKQVWVGQISRDIGTKLTIHSSYFMTHKIDPDVDEARYALMEDMAYSQALSKMGYVKGVGAAPKSAPRKNLTKDPYYTDGFRSVLIFDVHPTSLAEIKLLLWEGREGGVVDSVIRQKQ